MTTRARPDPDATKKREVEYPKPDTFGKGKKTIDGPGAPYQVTKVDATK